MGQESESNYSMRLEPADAYKFLVCTTHIGSKNAHFQSQNYIYKRRDDGKL